MSKGSGRRRITPSTGLHYDPETDMTNIEMRGGSHRQSASKELILGIRTGARPTTERHYGNQGLRRGGVGRKDDHRSWKSRSKGKQYEKNLAAREEQQHHRPVPDKVAARSREKSINADICNKLPCKAFSVNRRKVTLRDWVGATEKFLVKFGGDLYKGYAARRAQPYQYSYNYSNPSYYRSPRVKAVVKIPATGYALFEEKLRNLLNRIRLGFIDEYGQSVY